MIGDRQHKGFGKALRHANFSYVCRNKNFRRSYCSTLHVPTGGNGYYSTTELITFEENYSIRFIPIRKRKTGNRTYVDTAQLIASKRGIILLHIGLHGDIIITEYFTPFDMPWPELHDQNAFLNDVHGNLCTECGT